MTRDLLRSSSLRFWAFVTALIMCCWAVWSLEGARSGLVITEMRAGTTPMTVYREAGVTAPVVVIAHGFAGSRQLMEAYALTLAHAGYIAVTFDLEGHGRNPVPMSGDVTRIEGTTQILMREVGRVIDQSLTVPGADGRVALVGHSMASDIVVRQALADKRVGATVAVSMFSEAVTPDAPRNLLMVTGEWEGMLRAEALRNLRLAKATAEEGDTVASTTQGVGRRAVAAPLVEHVGVLYSPTALQETRRWLDAAFARESQGPVSATGGSIVLLLTGIGLLAWPLAGLFAKREEVVPRPPLRALMVASVLPALMTPLALRVVDTHFLPVLVADYLAVHLFVYGTLSLALLKWQGVAFGRFDWVAGLALAVFGIAVFGGALDRYVASFMPNSERLPIIAAIAVGAVPYMLSDAIACEGGRAPIWRAMLVRTLFLISLAIAVALDFERLMFLLIIIPVIILFFVIFGFMGGCVGRRTASPLAVGVGLGLVLAWSLGVSFPMFALT